MSNKKKIVLHAVKETMGVFYHRMKLHYDRLIQINQDTYEFILVDRIITEADFPLIEEAALVHVHGVPALTNENAFNLFYKAVKLNDGKFVVDLDDFWMLPETHPKYSAQGNKDNFIMKRHLFAMADCITVASKGLRMEVLKYHKNVVLIPNTYDPRVDQFVPKQTPYKDAQKVVIGWVGGSSHKADLLMLEGLVADLNADVEVKDKFKVSIAGWDTRGSNVKIDINPELIKELGSAYTYGLFNEFRKCQGDISKTSLPDGLKQKYAGQLYIYSERPVQPQESVYYEYERILTDNWKICDETDMMLLKDNFELQDDISLRKYQRIWTKDVTEYANAYDHIDIALAPLENNLFNKCKSNLKQIEAASRALPIICTNIPPYNEIGINNVNCVLVDYDPLKKKMLKKWYKAVKELVLDGEKRKKLGENLKKTVDESYNIVDVVQKRFDAYHDLITNNKA